MASGDGLIVRLKPRGGRLTPEQGIGIAAAAVRHGNGALDLTARANLQIRGVSDATLKTLLRALDGLGLLDPNAEAESRRNVVSSPLAGLDPSAAFDIRPTVALLEGRLAGETRLVGLPGKFGFAVSDGGAVLLDGVSTDVRFDAMPGGTFAVWLDGHDGMRACCAAAEMPEVALRLAQVFVDARAADPDLLRMRHLVAKQRADAIFAEAGLSCGHGASRTPRSVVEGASGPQRSNGSFSVGWLEIGVLGAAAAFGRLDAAQLDTLARGAARAGADELRLTPWRAILVPNLAVDCAIRLADDCLAAGLIVDPADKRLRVAACTGAPGCGRATTPVLDHAARWAGLLGAGDVSDGIVLHVSGCTKGCAHPAPASLTVVAREGTYYFATDRAAADTPMTSGFDAEEAPRLLKTATRLGRRP